VNPDVRVHEHEDLAASLAGSPVPDGADHVLLDAHDARPACPRNLGRAVRRHVVRDDHLHPLGAPAVGPAGGLDGVEQPGQKRFFVPGRDDDREQQVSAS
jgi:hypothetical protein